MYFPKAFAKELKFIDPTYKVEDDDEKKGYFIVKDLDLAMAVDGGASLPAIEAKIARIVGSLPILWTPELGGRCLETLRAMKKEALEMGIYDDPLKELAFWQKKKHEAKQKKIELAVDMITEGIMEAHRMGRRKSYSYGGSKPKEA